MNVDTIHVAFRSRETGRFIFHARFPLTEWRLWEAAAALTGRTIEQFINDALTEALTKERPIEPRWVVFCPEGPEVHGYPTTESEAKELARLLDEELPAHTHRAVPFYPWHRVTVIETDAEVTTG